MRKPALGAIRRALREAGTRPAQARRMLVEIGEHYDDLVDEAMQAGATRADAERAAVARLGRASDIARAARARPELRSWAARWPRVAVVWYPLACVAALPLVPVLAGLRHRESVARWAACLLLAGFVTAAMMLVLQLSITLG